ncbi:Transcription factor tau subunit sfc4 [Vanrija pseudolonga]|uniref:Transcription factor tau subunit sfc4 n=1 Tax=Vanrija pseudolonga TaxID=143232 RepID=A0AAF1BKX8_9TREE|nr:Transcription factor tau subunit sfc4 [Vanrija pseudolonga]
MSGFVDAEASGSQSQAHEHMDVDPDNNEIQDDEMQDDVEDQDDEGDEYSENGALSSDNGDDGSDDEYVDEPDEDGERDEDAVVAAEPEPEPAAPQPDDAIFQRLAGYVAGAPPAEGTEGQPAQGEGVGGAGFQNDLAALDEEELPQASKKPRRRVHRAHRPTYEVQQMLGRANMAYILAQRAEAVDLFLEVIRHDSQVQAAWTTLASIYEEMGEHEMSRQMRFCAAHIEEDIGLWRELAEEFKVDGNENQSLYCLRKALKIDPSSLDILWQLATVYRQLHKDKKAIDVYKKIHRIEPAFLRDFNMLMDIHPLIHEAKQFVFGSNVFGDAFLYHFAAFGGPEDQRAGPDQNTMQLEHIVVYVDYLLLSGDVESAVSTIHRGQRWIQGRKNQKGWDAIDDDSEYEPPKEADDEDAEGSKGGYDLDTQLRYRLALARLRLGQDTEAMVHINEILELDALIHSRMFKELGDALMKRELWESAIEFWASLHDRVGVDDEPAVIFKLGLCQHNLQRYDAALESLRWVVDMDKSNTEARMALARVLEDMGQKDEAYEIVTELTRARERGAKGERAPAERKATKISLQQQMADTMKRLFQDAEAAEEQLNEGEPWALEAFTEAADRMIETFRLAKSNFSKNRGVTRVITNRKKSAKSNIDSEVMDMQDRLERTLGFNEEHDKPIEGKLEYAIRRQEDFYGIKSEDWLAITIKYCCVLMSKDRKSTVYAMGILDHVVWSGPFNSRRCEVALRLTIIACAMRLGAYDTIVDNCKRLSQLHQFRPEPILLMLSAMGGGYKQQSSWQNLALQKFLHRELRIYDEAVCGVKLRYNSRVQRWAQIQTTGQSRRLGDFIDIDDEVDETAGKSSQPWRPGTQEVDEDDEPEEDEDGEAEGDGEEADASADPSGAVEGATEIPKPTKHSPVFNALYGQNMLTAKSYQSALFYFLRAYEVNQYDPLLCLFIAQAFFGRALVRQSDNRNYQIAQGLAFLARYRKLSPQDVVSQEEVEYNYGRAFHGLGIVHLAVKHYETVLESVRSRVAEQDDEEEGKRLRDGSLGREAAHNLVLIYSASASWELVQVVSDEWLALS